MNAQDDPAEALRSRIECLVCQMMEILGVSNSCNYKDLRLSRALNIPFSLGCLTVASFSRIVLPDCSWVGESRLVSVWKVTVFWGLAKGLLPSSSFGSSVP